MPLITDNTAKPFGFSSEARPEGYEATPEPQTLGAPSVGETFGAAFRQENEVLGAIKQFDQDNNFGDVDHEHNPWASVQGTELEPYADAFVASRNQKETDHIASLIRKEIENRKILERSNPALVFGAGMVASVLSPTTLIPGGVIYRGMKVGRAATKSALTVGAANAAAAGIQEGVLHGQQYTRTGEESAFAIGGSFLLAAILGGAASGLSSAKFKNLADALDRDLNVGPRIDEAYAAKMGEATGRMGEGGVGAQSVAIPDAELKGAFGLEKTLIKTEPVGRSMNRAAPEVANAEVRLAEMPMTLTRNAEGFPTAPIGGAIETRIKTQGISREGAALAGVKQFYADYRFGDPNAKLPGFKNLINPDKMKLSQREFREEVGKAMARGDAHDIPQVAKAAKHVRETLIDPIADAAVKANLLSREIVRKGRPKPAATVGEGAAKPELPKASPQMKASIDNLLSQLEGYTGQKFDKAVRERVLDLVAQNEDLLTRLRELATGEPDIPFALRGDGGPVGRSIHEVVADLEKGYPVKIEREVTDYMDRVLQDARLGLPPEARDVPMHYMVGVEPKGDGHVAVSFHGVNGEFRSLDLSLSDFRQARAASLDGSLFLFRSSVVDGFDKSLIGEIQHELVHALAARGVLGGDVLARLSVHAESLRIMDMSLNDMLRRIDHPDAGRAQLDEPLSVTYNLKYKNRGYSDELTAELVNEEAIAHMAELRAHGKLTDEELAPIADDMERLFGPVGGLGAARQKAVADWVEQLGNALKVDPDGGVQFALRGSDVDVGRSMRADLDRLGYFSGALEAAKRLRQAKGTPEQMLAMLQKEGAKKAEIEATGLDKFILGRETDAGAAGDGRPSATGAASAEGRTAGQRAANVSRNQITKSEIIKYLEDNRVDVREKVYGGDAKKTDEAALAAQYRDRGMSPDQAAIMASRVARAREGIAVEDPKWQPYSLDPDNPTYRETVLHLPMPQERIRMEPMEPFGPSGSGEAMWQGRELVTGVTEAPFEIGGQWGRITFWPKTGNGGPPKYVVNSPNMQNAAFDTLDEATSAIEKSYNGTRNSDYMGRSREDVFRSGHFAEPNIIGHMMTSMVKHEGKATYLIDQIQSDWGQKLRGGGVRDEAKIAELKAKAREAQRQWDSAKDAAAAKFAEAGAVLPKRPATGYTSLDFAQAIGSVQQGDAYLRSIMRDIDAAKMEAERIAAELRTAEAATPGHPLVNTTDQWTNTTLRRAIRQAVEADAEYIAVPTGDTVLSYNPGDTEGMWGFYGHYPREALAKERAAMQRLAESEEALVSLVYKKEAEQAGAPAVAGIVPKNLKNLLRKIDKSSPDPVVVDKLDTPGSGMKGEGFTLFKLTDKVKQSVKEQGQPLFAMRDVYRGQDRPLKPGERFKPGSFFTDKPLVASEYGGHYEQRGYDFVWVHDDGVVYRGKLDTDGFKEVDAAEIADSENGPWLDQMVAQAKEEGHPGIVFKNVIDELVTGRSEPHSQIVVFDEKRLADLTPSGGPMFALRDFDKDLADKAVKHFGLTRDASEAGYILPDGRMLDFTGRHYAGGVWNEAIQAYRLKERDYLAGSRSVDHRELEDLTEAGGTDGMHEFMRRSGAIRYQSHTGGFEAFYPPSESQIKAILRAHSQRFRGEPLDIDVGDPVTGEIIKSVFLDRPTLRKVLDVFGGGTDDGMMFALRDLSRRLDAPLVDDLGKSDPHPGRVMAVHGTKAQPFDQFDPTKSADFGIHFGTRDQADIPAGYTTTRENARMIPVVLDLKTVVDVPDMMTWPPVEVAQAVEKAYPLARGLEDRVRAVIAAGSTETGPTGSVRPSREALAEGKAELRRLMSEAKIDGLRYWNDSEGEGWSYIVWDEGKVSSATSGAPMMGVKPDGQPQFALRGNGEDILKKVRELGGIKDETGDLANMGAGERKGIINNETGLSPDAMRAHMVEQGYLDDVPYEDVTQSSVNDLYDMISEALSDQGGRGRAYREEMAYQALRSAQTTFEEAIGVKLELTPEQEKQLISMILDQRLSPDDALERLGMMGAEDKPQGRFDHNTNPERYTQSRRFMDDLQEQINEFKTDDGGDYFNEDVGDEVWGGAPGQTYIMRLYNREKIAKQTPVFRSILSDYFQEAQSRANVALNRMAGEVRDAEARAMASGKQAKIAADTEKNMADLQAFVGLSRQDLDEISDQVINHILGAPEGRLTFDLPNAVRGALKSRTLRIPDAFESASGKFEDFLDRDIGAISRAYVQSMVPDTEIVRMFGSLNMEEQYAKIKDQYAKMRSSPELDKLPPAQAEKIRKKLNDDMNAALVDLSAQIDRLRGTYKLPDNPMAWGPRAVRVLKEWNLIRMLGGMTVSALPDPFRIMMVHGVTGFFGDGIRPLITNMKAVKMAGEEVKMAGTALDMILHSRIQAIADVMDNYGRYSTAERGLGWAVDKFGVLTLMNQWNSAMKQWAGSIVMTNLIRMAKKIDAGKATNKEIETLASASIDAFTARTIAQQFAKHGMIEGGVHLPNTLKWDVGDPNVKLALEAFRGAVVRDVDRIIVTPGQDKPLMASTQIGSLVFQFKSFAFASMQRTLVAGLQQRDSGVVMGMLMMVGMGMVVEYLKALTNDKPLPANTAQWVAAGVDRSGVQAWLSDANNIVEKMTGGTVGVSALTGKQLSRYASRNLVSALAGPSAGTITDLGVASAGFHRALLGGDQIRESDIASLRRLIPLQNLFYLSYIFQKMEQAVSKGVGAKPSKQRSPMMDRLSSNEQGPGWLDEFVRAA